MHSTTSQTASRRRGFTLIELLIVIVVIAILALIVIPRVMGAGRKARESSLKANLHIVRNAIAQFQADTGLFPSQLSDLTLAKASAPTTGIDEAGTTGVTVPTGTYQGPYLAPNNGGINNSGIPANPFINPDATGYGTTSNHWTYPVSGSPGAIRAAGPSGNTSDGVAYTAL